MTLASVLLAALGFMVLIVLHELGHFAAAKWVGMRVERFALFFPPLWARTQRGETEYAIGSIPLGGYVKITGMNPAEEIPPEVEHRAYYRQPVWKRIVVISAGPAVNIVLAFLILCCALPMFFMMRRDRGGMRELGDLGHSPRVNHARRALRTSRQWRFRHGNPRAVQGKGRPCCQWHRTELWRETSLGARSSAESPQEHGRLWTSRY